MLNGIKKRLISNKSAFWMPFTANQAFKALPRPRLLDRAEGMYYYTHDNVKILDATSGLWCSNAGHNNKKITAAIQNSAAHLDYAPSFQLSHSKAFEYADRLAEEILPEGLDKVFFSMCGSTAVDSALKMCLAYHKAKGNLNRVRFIGRERGYHGVGFGGISVGGILANRHQFSTSLLPNVDHLSHTHSLPNMAFSKGCPSWGAHLADDLERIVALHGGDTIAAVIVEPVAGSTGVLVPPVGYLQRLRNICDKHGILLIFDEVITGFGRLGAPTASHYFNVTPDLITVAKGMTNAAVPAGAVFAKSEIYDTVTKAVKPGGIEFFHGYTYSAHPLACAAGLAALDVYKEQGLFQNCSKLSKKWEAGLHSLRSASPFIIDIRNIGLMGAIEFKSVDGSVGKRAATAFQNAYDKGLLIRVTADTIALSPPLIVNDSQINEIISILGDVLKKIE